MVEAGRVESVIREFLRRANKAVDSLDREQQLYAGGLGLDSLATAELSAVLEDELGTDPFSEGEMPQTVGELLDFYVSAATG